VSPNEHGSWTISYLAGGIKAVDDGKGERPSGSVWWQATAPQQHLVINKLLLG
jgi:hypothetical protein